MTKFKDLFETEDLQEGELWDMFKGTVQLVKIMNDAKKNIQTVMTQAKKEHKTPEDMMKIFTVAVKEVFNKIDGTVLSDEMKKTTKENFISGIESEMNIKLKQLKA